MRPQRSEDKAVRTQRTVEWVSKKETLDWDKTLFTKKGQQRIEKIL